MNEPHSAAHIASGLALSLTLHIEEAEGGEHIRTEERSTNIDGDDGDDDEFKRLHNASRNSLSFRRSSILDQSRDYYLSPSESIL
jgi:hypothetical protein